jgi:transposase
MSFSFKVGQRIFIYRELLDFRSGFERMVFLVEQELKQKIVDGDLFIFLGKNRILIRCLCFDGTGLVQIRKRMESGKFQSLESLPFDEITVEELEDLFKGGLVRRKVFGKVPA